MQRLVGTKRVNVAVFISGKGSNLKNLIIHSLKKNSKFKISLVISSKVNAKGMAYAKKYKIKKKTIDFKNIKNAEKSIFVELKKNNIRLICLAGFMKILSSNFIKRFRGVIINIHPSLLPKYKGLNTHERVINNGEKFTGCTIHFVNKYLDSGKIIVQKKVKIKKNDDPKSIEKKVLKMEHKIYPQAIFEVLSNL